MASIPLPALAVQQPESPIDRYAKVIALRDMIQRQQLFPGQLQAQQQGLELQNQQIQSTKALQQAYVEANGDLDKVAPLAVKYGAKAQDAQAMVNAALEQKQKIATLTKDQQAILENQTKVQGQHSRMLLGIQDPEARQQAYTQQTIPALQQLGIPANQIPAQVPDELTLKAHSTAAMSVDQQLEEQRKSQQFTQEHGELPDDKRQQINDALTARYNVLNPGQKPPSTYQLPAGATVDDFNRVDKLMEQTEKAQATKAQRDTANGFRAQAAALANLAAQEKIAQLNKPTADEQRRSDLADNLTENLTALKELAQRRPDLFGPLAGRVTALKNAFGTSDPDVAALETLKHQIGMAQISAHGMRSAQGIADAAASVVNGFHNEPEALIGTPAQNGKPAVPGSIDTALNSVATFKNQASQARSGARTGITQDMVPGAKKPTVQPPANDPLGLFK